MLRPEVHGLGQALHGDKTTTGATLISDGGAFATCDGRGIIRRGDRTTACPKCGKPGVVIEGDPRTTWHGEPTALHGHRVNCGCPPGSNRIIAPLGSISSGNSSYSNNDNSQPYSALAPVSDAPKRFDEQFRIVDEDGAPLANVPYFIRDSLGTAYKGFSDREGKTPRIHTTREDLLEISTGVAALEKWNQE